jgi:hypothetical protein
VLRGQAEPDATSWSAPCGFERVQDDAGRPISAENFEDRHQHALGVAVNVSPRISGPGFRWETDSSTAALGYAALWAKDVQVGSGEPPLHHRVADVSNDWRCFSCKQHEMNRVRLARGGFTWSKRRWTGGRGLEPRVGPKVAGLLEARALSTEMNQVPDIDPLAARSQRLLWPSDRRQSRDPSRSRAGGKWERAPAVGGPRGHHLEREQRRRARRRHPRQRR